MPLFDTETTCHCGAAFDGSDHCPECGCEQYESLHCDVLDRQHEFSMQLKAALEDAIAEEKRIKALKQALRFSQEDRLYRGPVCADGQPNASRVLQSRYKHDCDRCVLICWRDCLPHLGLSGDWYVCPQGGMPTVVIRHSDEPSDYSSGDRLITQLDDADDTKALGKSLMRHWNDKKRWSDIRRARVRQRRREIRKAGGWEGYMDRMFKNLPLLPELPTDD